MLSGKIIKTSITSLTVASVLLAAWGCGGDDPTAPETAEFTLSGAKVSINDQSLNGRNIHQGEFTDPMRFEARLADRHGNLIPGGRVEVQFGMPGMMGNMMNGYTGEFYCYDDGTHGDPVAGDGVYCFVDSVGDYGCHRAGAQLGEYSYEFCGYDQHGQKSNRMQVEVTLVP
ncbi:MAG: hypothetical protein ACI9UK_001320 [Candidatus Krumholzibacteriia bacterium]|jgi:hypothetical protein